MNAHAVRTTRGRNALAEAIALAVLALALFGAACPGQRPARPVATVKHVLRTRADSADQLMFGVRGVLTHGSVSRGILLADTALVSEDGTRYELRNLRITFFDSAGVKNSELLARAGTYHLRQARIEPSGEVTIVGKGGRRLQTGRAVYDLARNLIVGDTAYVVYEAAPGSQRSGKGFETDPQLVRVRNPARPARPARAAAPTPR